MSLEKDWKERWSLHDQGPVVNAGGLKGVNPWMKSLKNTNKRYIWEKNAFIHGGGKIILTVKGLPRTRGYCVVPKSSGRKGGDEKTPIYTWAETVRSIKQKVSF